MILQFFSSMCCFLSRHTLLLHPQTAEFYMLCKSFLSGDAQLLQLSCITDSWAFKYFDVWTHQRFNASLAGSFCIPPEDLRTSPAFQRLMESFWAYAEADIMHCAYALTWAVNSNLAQSKVCKQFWLQNLWLWIIYCTFQVQVCLQEWILQGGNCNG